MAVINGNNDPNILQGTNQNDTMHALGGNDIVYGNDGNDLITGGLGNDILHSGNGDDVVNGEAGNDRLVFSGTGHNTGDGGDGTDTIEIDMTHLASDVQVTTTWNFHVGALNNYTIRASDQSASTRIDGYELVIIRSGAGDDRLNGTRGKDKIYGNDGDDSLGDSRFGGNDIFYGGRGDDYLIGNSRNDRLFGGSGDDTFWVRYATGSKAAKGVVNGGGGNDSLRLFLGSNRDQNIAFEAGIKNVLSDGLTVDKIEKFDLTTASGDDSLVLKVTTAAELGWSAGFGTDHATLDLSQAKGLAQFSYGHNSGSGRWMASGKETVVAVRDIEGLTLIGNDKKNVLRGGDFDNLIRGGDGDDHLSGGRAQDQLFGENGRDNLSGGWGDDLLDGGAGSDFLYGWVGNDILRGGTGTDRLEGALGNDQLDGGAGTDFLFGGDGDDTLDGGTEQDRLYGDAGEDTLNGGDGRDRIDGGTGADDLTGGGGADLFIFDKGDGTDRILDFALGSDQIHLRRTGFSETDMILTQQTDYVEITFAGDTSTDGTVIQVVNVTLAELDNAANFIF